MFSGDMAFAESEDFGEWSRASFYSSSV